MRLPFSHAAILLQVFNNTELNGPGNAAPESPIPFVSQRQTPPSPAPATSGVINFTPCPPSTGLTPNIGLECANFSVPVDWSDSSSTQIKLGMVRLAAQSPTQRIGNLFFNPGGPGISAASIVNAIANRRQNFSDVIRQRFDVIGLDPRGVGLSAPVRCDSNVSNAIPPLLDPNDANSLQALIQINSRIAASCRNLTGPVFDKVDTISAARDMEAVRVGNEPLNWLGQSYGTQLGAQYASLFPGNVRAMVLDGVLQHSGSTPSQLLIEQTSVESTLKKFFAASSHDPQSPLAGQDPATVWANVTSAAAAGTLKARGCDGTPATGCLANVPVENVVGGGRNMLFFEFAWNKQLGKALALAHMGDGIMFATGLSTGTATDNEGFAFNAIACQDGIETGQQTLAEVQKRALVSRTFATVPGMNEFWRTKTLCDGWTPAETNPKKQLNVVGLANPVLLVNSINDPATSVVWAQGMNDEISGSVLTFRNGSGHTSYFIGNESKKAMDDYLVSLKVPAPGTIFQS
ncbi:uncharacterized protein BCR38DRAFT_521038 [Pseudomassariella vexata]|uniref:TAP-like protein-domain-containing protein n=1 Tax=Pseudomassariella vexata TaxID=1141098 RepID=A0A1Y2EF67_9PEZI|nr:uncharacterized protein BCR38DRAFT_521038 [Pseudomassariella vexata]ORY70210.1 hypothetical protein BCR38DRAFT_521038 [Pseudomassariella vexata]